jgi:hypothetical protein
VAEDDLESSTDTDGDGLSDYYEKYYYGTNPTKVDTDGGGVDDLSELNVGTSPTAPEDDGKSPYADLDGDGAADSVEAIWGTGRSQ